MQSSQALILIPARYESTRFPGKPLSKILGQSMIQRVYENMSKSGFPTFVVTDDQRIEDHVKEFGGQSLRVDDETKSGSERIYLALKRYFKDQEIKYVVNVQGDEPLLQAQTINELVSLHDRSDFDITTLVRPRENDVEDFKNPNTVKAVVANHRCLYFSRSAIPHDRSGKLGTWFHHIGVYCYKAEALEKFCQLPAGEYEERESLEQLRALENGLTIGANKIKEELIGVDAPEDIKKVEGVLSGQE